jgi:tetratricopeptide (TPR) repeat protein
VQETLGHYRVVEQIGSGGMGVVYRARDERLERDVAIKVLSADRLSDNEARRRFRREALALSKLNHPNIATIHDFDTIDGIDLLVMEHIPGRNLDALIEGGPLPEREISRLGQQLLNALEAAHEHGVIHRDLKPGNVRVTPDGRLKVLDFGLARALQLDGNATTDSMTGSAFAGTLPYMAPEQLRGDAIDARTDIYACGAVFYELATGSRVHAGLSGTRLMSAILDDVPVPPRALNPRISQELERVLCKALDKDPQLRYQSARELRVDLERLAVSSLSQSGRLPARRPRPRAAVVAAVTTALLLLAAATAYWRWPTEAALPPRGWIVVSDFEDSSGQVALASGLRSALTLQLEQSAYANVLSREQVFEARRRMQRVEGPLDHQTARELCVRENVPLLLAGRIQRLGDVTRVDVRGIQPATGEVRFAEYIQFTDERDVLERIDALARRVRRQLGESLNGIEQRSHPLAKVTTQSLRALEPYSVAADELARGQADRALPLLQAALSVDPAFGMAHRLIARVYETLGNVTKEREHLARAYELRDKLTERERLHVEASYLLGQGKYEEAVGRLTTLTTLYPGDGEARYELAIAYRNAGEMNKAIQELEAMLIQSPYVTGAYGDLVLLLARTGDYRRAQEVAARARQRQITSARLTWGHAMVSLGLGKLDEARAELRRLEAGEEIFAGVARLYLATADMYEGKLAAAARQLHSAILLDQKSRNALPERKRKTLLAAVASLQGDDQEARRQLAAATGESVAVLGPEDSRRIGTYWARLGEVARARDLLNHLETLRGTVGSAFVESCYLNLAGELALAQREYARALEFFRRAASQYPRPSSSIGEARTYTALEDWARARAAWSEVLEWKGEILQEGFATDWVLAMLERGRAARRAGVIDDARNDYSTFLETWRNADDVPIRREALRESAAFPPR